MTVFKNSILLSILFLLTPIIFAQENITSDYEVKTPHNIFLKNLDDHRMVKYFLEVYAGFEDIDDLDIVLTKKHFKSSTMQAQPKISFQTLFGKRKQYKININKFVKTTDSRVSELPEAVLKGWFAHEIGHIIDYHSRSNFGMTIFGIRYIFSKNFRKQAEHNADIIAVTYGFSEDIIAMKKYLLESEYISAHYKDKIIRFYMSLQDVYHLVEENITEESR